MSGMLTQQLLQIIELQLNEYLNAFLELIYEECNPVVTCLKGWNLYRFYHHCRTLSKPCISSLHCS